MLRGLNLVVGFYLSWREAICTMSSRKVKHRSLTERKSWTGERRMEDFFLYKKELELSASCNNFVFSVSWYMQAKKVRELEILHVLLSLTIVPLEIPPSGDSSSRVHCHSKEQNWAFPFCFFGRRKLVLSPYFICCLVRELSCQILTVRFCIYIHIWKSIQYRKSYIKNGDLDFNGWLTQNINVSEKKKESIFCLLHSCQFVIMAQ